MNTQTIQSVIDRLDGVLSEEENQKVDKLVATDTDLAAQYDMIRFVTAQVYEAGLYQQVGKIRNEQHVVVEHVPNVPVIKMTFASKLMRIAAVLLFVGISATVYKLASVSPESVFNDNYRSYELNTDRSDKVATGIEAAFRKKEWNTITSVVPDNNFTSKEFFLTGMAHAELQQHTKAIENFKAVLALNKTNNDNYFQDDAEYYLAMSYLAVNNFKDAWVLVSQIQRNNSHTYHDQAKRMNFDLKLIDLKD